jgi:hypothetical protein
MYGSVQVNVHNPDTTSVSIHVSPTDPCSGQQYVVANGVNGGSGARYDWYVNYQLVTNSGNRLSTAGLSSGDLIYCIMSTAQACAYPLVDTSNNLNITICPTNGVAQNELEKSISLYPNPNNGHFALSIDEPGHDLNITLLNIEGTQVFEKHYKDLANFNQELDLSYLPQGIYLLKISNEKGVAVKRLILER